MPATFTAKFNFGYGWFLGEDPGTEPLDFQTKAIDALMLDAFGQDIANTAGLTYGYRGAWLYQQDTRIPFNVVGSTIVLPANSISYVQRNKQGIVTFDSSFLINNIPMAIVTTNNFEIVNVIDARTVNGSFPNLVDSVFGRIGNVVAISGDYSADMIRLLMLISRYPSADNVQQVLELMNTDIALALSEGVKSFSPVNGLARTGNVFTQYGDYTADMVSVINAIPGIDISHFTNPSVQDVLGLISAKAGVSSFNLRVGNVQPVNGDYPAGFVPYNDVVVTIPLLPEGVSIGGNVQSALDAFKQHFHDATQIIMNPTIVAGKDTVQKMLQWLFDNRGSGTSGNLVMTTPDYSYSGTAPFGFDLTLTATGGIGPYTWTYVSGNIPGDPANGSALPTGHLVVSGIGSAGVFSATIQVTDSTPVTPLVANGTITVTLAAASGAPVITSFTASPNTVNLGAPTTLNWSVTGATSLSIDQGVGTVTGTSQSITPSATTIYTLTATNAYGSTTATLLMTVNSVAGLPIISSFTAVPTRFSPAGEDVLLSWTTVGATSLAIKETGNVFLNGNLTFGPYGPYYGVTGTSKVYHPTSMSGEGKKYTLQATNSFGSVTSEVTLVPKASIVGLLKIQGVFNETTYGSGIRDVSTSVPRSGVGYKILPVIFGPSGGVGPFTWALGTTGQVDHLDSQRINGSSLLGSSITINGSTGELNIPINNSLVDLSAAYWLEVLMTDTNNGDVTSKIFTVTRQNLGAIDQTGFPNWETLPSHSWIGIGVSNEATDGAWTAAINSYTLFDSVTDNPNTETGGSFDTVIYAPYQSFFATWNTDNTTTSVATISYTVTDTITGLTKIVKNNPINVDSVMPVWHSNNVPYGTRLEAETGTYNYDLELNFEYPYTKNDGIVPLVYSATSADSIKLGVSVSGHILTLRPNFEISSCAITETITDAHSHVANKTVNVQVDPAMIIGNPATYNFTGPNAFYQPTRITLTATGGLGPTPVYRWTHVDADENFTGASGAGSCNNQSAVADGFLDLTLYPGTTVITVHVTNQVNGRTISKAITFTYTQV